MTTTRDWKRNRDMWVRVLEKQTGEGVDAWNHRIVKEGLRDERELRTWLTRRRVTGYAQSLLVMERFGYPDFVLATANELIDRQYRRPPRTPADLRGRRRRSHQLWRGGHPGAQDICVPGVAPKDVRPRAADHPNARRSRAPP